MALSAADEARVLITTSVEGVPETDPRRVDGTDEAGEGDASRFPPPTVVEDLWLLELSPGRVRRTSLFTFRL